MTTNTIAALKKARDEAWAAVELHDEKAEAFRNAGDMTRAMKEEKATKAAIANYEKAENAVCAAEISVPVGGR